MSGTDEYRLDAWTSLGVGVAAAMVGLIPWLVHGMQLPVQNLGVRMTGPGDVVLLPYSQYSLIEAAALIVVGAAAAGIASRAVAVWFRFVMLGMLIAQTLAVMQTTAVVVAILQPRMESVVYLGVLVAVAVLAMAMGFGVAVLVARAPRAGALIGLAVAAVLADAWMSGLILPFVSPLSSSVTDVLMWLQWTSPVLVGAAVAWCGVGSIGRAVAAIGALLILWLGSASVTAVSAAAGMRVLARRLPDLFAYALAVFESAATEPVLVLRSLGIAVGTAVVGLAIGFGSERIVVRRVGRRGVRAGR
jgi:hypothetical protein